MGGAGRTQGLSGRSPQDRVIFLLQPRGWCGGSVRCRVVPPAVSGQTPGAFVGPASGVSDRDL